MAQFSRTFPTAYAADANPDRWFYNATLSNPSTGDVTEVLGRYAEQRTVPLLDNCEGFYVALARLSVVGSTASLPVLMPALLSKAAASDNYINTDYWVGLRYTLYDASNNAVGYSDIVKTNLTPPSLYPNDARSDPTSKFYWIDSAAQLVTAINTAIAVCAANKQGIPLYASGSTVVPASTKPGMTAAATYPFANSGMPYYVSLDKSSYRITVHSPIAQTSYELNLPAGSGTFTASCHLLFSDKLLELFPMEATPAFPTTGPLVSGSTITPTNANNYVTCVLGAAAPVVIGVAPQTYTPTALATALTAAFTAASYPCTCTYASSTGLFSLASTVTFTITTGSPLLTLLGYDQPVTVPAGGGVTATHTPAFDPFQTLLYTPSWLTSPQPSSGVSMYVLQTDPFTADDTDTAPVTPFNPAVTTCVPEYLFEQEYEATGAWSPFTGLAITSNLIPAVEEAFGVNITPNQDAVQAAGAASSNIIFDIDLTQDTIHQIQSGIAFTPAIFRYAKLKPAPLTGVDLNFFLKRRDGVYVPWQVTNGGTISVKLMFTRTPY